MRVLHVTGDARISGPSAAALAVAKALAANGVHVRLQCVPGGGLESAAREAGILSPVPMPTNPASIFHMGAVKAAVAAASSALQAEVIHCHRSPEHLAACRLRGRAGVPVVRSYNRGEAEPPSLFTRWLMGWRTSAVIAPSHSAAEAAANALGSVKVVPAAGIVDGDAFRPRHDTRDQMQAAMGAGPDDVLVGAVGRFAPARRLDEFILGFDEFIQPDGVTLRGVVLGRGAQRTELETMAAQLVPDGRLRVVETSDRFSEQISALDIGVQMCPGSDGTCRTTLEMMASGIAVVVGSRGALPEIVDDGATGRVVDLRAPGSLAQAVSGLARDPALRRQLGENARAVALERNSAETVAASYVQTYTEVIEDMT